MSKHCYRGVQEYVDYLNICLAILLNRSSFPFLIDLPQNQGFEISYMKTLPSASSVGRPII